MRWTRVFVTVLFVSLAIPTQEADAGSPKCTQTHCGMACIVYGEFGGYCNPPAEESTGCIQLYGPDCASLDGAYCCSRQLGAL
jgi:hypothetical protein